jgi:hypothetical protein
MERFESHACHGNDAADLEGPAAKRSGQDRTSRGAAKSGCDRPSFCSRSTLLHPEDEKDLLDHGDHIVVWILQFHDRIGKYT